MSQVDAEITSDVVEDLIDWFGASPASWLTHRPAAGLTATLLETGARPERSGRWSGLLTPTTVRDEHAAVEVVHVRSEDDIDRWLEVATACGWIRDDQDRRARRALYTAADWDGALTHWLVLDGDEAVGFASSYSHGHVLDLCNLGVLASRRREGIGRALVAARLAAGHSPKITLVVSAPSPDGWRLQHALGFASVPVVPNRCFYLPTAPRG